VLRIRDVLSRIRIPDPGGEKAPDPGSRILLYIKIGMKNKIKPTFFLLFIVSGESFISKKNKEQGILRKSHQKTYPLDPGKIHPGSGSRIQGVKKHRISDPEH
jgi:hypothetical protein